MWVIEYALEGVEGGEPIYRLMSNLPDAEMYPAHELAALQASFFTGGYGK